MRAVWIASTLVLRVALLYAQAPPAAQANDLGYAYTLPDDWQILTSNPTLAGVKQQAQQNASSDEEKKGVACVQVAETARGGDPPSVLVVVQLPFDCFGQSMNAKDLPGFAHGASEGIKQNFDLSDPASASYMLGSHSMWIERAGSAQGASRVDVHGRDHMHGLEKRSCVLDGDGRKSGCLENPGEQPRSTRG